MESKKWLRRRVSEKTITKERVLDMERSLQNLNEQLSSVRNEADTKDDLISKQAKVAEEAIEGWQKAAAEAVSLKLELDNALHQKSIAEEKIASLHYALKECVQRFQDLKNEQQRTVNDVAQNMAQERQKTQILEQKLANANQRFHRLSVEKSNLCGVLDLKEELIKDLNIFKSQSEAGFTAIVERLDISERSNESLKCEVLVLQKELVIRNKEREFNLRSAESAQKQHRENIRKINRLDAECHRLRCMIRKRFPGLTAISKMGNEVEMLGNSASEARRNLNYTMNFTRDIAPGLGHDALSKQVIRLREIEDENKFLKESLKKKNNELQLSRIMFSHTSSKLSQAEKQLELTNGPSCFELARSNSVIYELPQASVSEASRNEDNVSCAESSSTLMSQLERLRFEKPANSLRAIGSLQSSLMNDFEEMEKLATIHAEKPEEGPGIISGENGTFLTPKAFDLKLKLLESIGKELVSLDNVSDFGEFDHGDQSSCARYEKHPAWLQDILEVIFQKHDMTQLTLDVILNDVRAALSKNKTIIARPSLEPLAGNNACQELHHSSLKATDGGFMKNFFPSETCNKQLQLKFEHAMHRIIELIDGFIWRKLLVKKREHLISFDYRHNDPQNKPGSSLCQTACVILWESSELTTVLQRFVNVCNTMLCRRSEVEQFVSELALALGWIFDHCFSLEDVSAMEEPIMKQFGNGDYTEIVANSPNEANSKTSSHGKFNAFLGKSLPSTMSAGVYKLSRIDVIGSKHKDEISTPNYKIADIESGINDHIEIFKIARAKNHIDTQIQEPENCISTLQSEQKTLKYSRGLAVEKIEVSMLTSQDLETQLIASKVELNETCPKFSSLEAKLKESKTTSLERQDQIECVSDKDMPIYEMMPEEKELKTGWAVSVGSKKLAECQETILQLGKQLKALASPKEAALFDNMISSAAMKRSCQSSNLHGQLMAIDNGEFEDLKSSQTKETIWSDPQNHPIAEKTDAKFLNFIVKDKESSLRHSSQVKLPDSSKVTGVVSIPKKQKGGIYLLKKLITFKKKEECNKKLPLVNASFRALHC